MRKLLIFLCLAVLCLDQASAQNHVITGTVTDANGAPVAGASILIKGTKRGTTSGIDGTFRISVPAGTGALVISGVGLSHQEIDILDKTNLGTIALTTANKDLDEVVVVAYGQSKKTNITGSVATIKGGELADKPFTSVDKELQGAVAGVQSSSVSGQPGSNTDIVIRGIGSIQAGSSPLWVIDGVIATTGDLTSNTTTANALSGFNPNDIESVTILKDAAATAIYGSQGANGVILVTTKKGRAGKTAVNFSTEVGANSRAFQPKNKPMTTPQTQTLLREAVINAGLATTNAGADSAIVDPNGYVGLPDDYTATNTDWTKVVTRTGTQQDYNLSLSGGDQKTQFYMSGGYFKQLGTVLASDFNRYTGSLSLTHHANDQLTVGGTISGGATNQNTPQGSSAFLNPVMETYFLPSWYAPYNANGSFNYSTPPDYSSDFVAGSGLENPVIISAWNVNNDKQNSFRGNVFGEYKILNNLKFTSRYSAEYFDISEHMYWNPLYGDGYTYSGYAFDSYRRTFDYTFSNFADYRGNLNSSKDFYFDLKAGYESHKISNSFLQAAGEAFPATLALQNLTSAATPLTAYADPTAASLLSMFSMGDINYKDRYVLTGTFRRDGSSVFGADHRYGDFYSVGATWNIIEEDFLKNSTLFSLLKLRGSYGTSGNQNLGYYTALPTYGYGDNYTGLPGSALNNVGNPNLTWEKEATGNIGLDWGLWKDRLYGTFEVYDRKTTALLISVPLSPTSGVSGQNRNVGAMTNKGEEITIGGRPIVTRGFIWDVSFNFSHNTNKVTQLYQNTPINQQSSTTPFNITVGHDIHDYYLKQWDGANPADGTPLWFTDGTHSKTTGTFADAALDLSGKSASPKYFGSFTNTFSYAGFSLTAQFYYNFGNYVFNYWGKYFESDGLYLGGYNQLSDQLSGWQKPGDKSNTPQVILGGAGGGTSSYGYSTRFLYKGDYIRLRNLQLSYAIPKSALKSAHIANLSLYIRGTNLWTTDVDKHIPLDPETGINSGNGFDVFIPKTITGGLKIGF
jgi:TonB-linked SusC/RagA family outer membrane protein